MKIAFDLDGTLSRHPEKLLELAKVLQRGGAECIVLTATAGELAPHLRPDEAKNRLHALGIVGIGVVCCESTEKPAKCRDMGVDLLIDDTAFEMLPGTVLLRI